MTLPTRWKLGIDLISAGFTDMADRAIAGWYDDYLSPLDMPTTELVNDLQKAGTPAAMLIREQVIKGDYDATAEEAEAWAASPEGREAFESFLGSQAPWPNPKMEPPKD
jgi:hypothetical protein